MALTLECLLVCSSNFSHVRMGGLYTWMLTALRVADGFSTRCRPILSVMHLGVDGDVGVSVGVHASVVSGWGVNVCAPTHRGPSRD